MLNIALCKCHALPVQHNTLKLYYVLDNDKIGLHFGNIQKIIYRDLINPRWETMEKRALSPLDLSTFSQVRHWFVTSTVFHIPAIVD